MMSSIHQIIVQSFIAHDIKCNASYSEPIDYDKKAIDILKAWEDLFTIEGLSEKLIQTIHSLISSDTYIPIFDKTGSIIGFSKAGAYRTINSSIVSHIEGLRMQFIPPQNIQENIKRLVNTMNLVFASKISPELMLENILAFALEFIMIHPFADQNGRTMHILMELLAAQSGLLPFHIAHINAAHYDELIYAQSISRELHNVAPFRDVLLKYRTEALEIFTDCATQGENK